MIEVKGNQKTLLRYAQKVVAENKAIDTYLSEEKNRGRQEHRFHQIYQLSPDIPEGWHGIERIVYVHRYGYRPDKSSNEGKYSEEHYYIAGYPFNNAQFLAKGIRNHWGIENKIHYVKDTHFKEDKNKIRHNHAAAILSTFQDIAINVYRCHGIQSIQRGTIFFANKIKELFRFLNAKHISDL